MPEENAKAAAATARDLDDAERREALNADGQRARLAPNTTGEFSVERAAEGFEKIGRDEGRGEKTDERNEG